MMQLMLDLVHALFVIYILMLCSYLNFVYAFFFFFYLKFFSCLETEALTQLISCFLDATLNEE